MSAGFRAAYDLGLGVALLLVALNVGDAAGRLHRCAARHPRAGAVLAPVVLRAVGAVFGVIGTTIGAVRLVHAAA
ncbi:hypothetical protein ACFYYN_35145 [Streptomyces sp. NPDC001902]